MGPGASFESRDRGLRGPPWRELGGDGSGGPPTGASALSAASSLSTVSAISRLSAPHRFPRCRLGYAQSPVLVLRVGQWMDIIRAPWSPGFSDVIGVGAFAAHLQASHWTDGPAASC